MQLALFAHRKWRPAAFALGTRDWQQLTISRGQLGASSWKLLTAATFAATQQNGRP
jgi:hypothetical protein